jgi:DNA-binding MarR family transcriptional regulator
MDPKDIHTLKILEKVEKNQSTSQRDLAKDLNISLGLVNSFIKRLAKKGYFKITTIPKNRMRYILTPKGAAEKTRLTYAYIQYSYNFYKDARRKLHELFFDLESEGIRTIVFYGASDLAEIAYLSVQDTAIRLVAIVDDQKVGKKIMGMLVSPPDFLKKNMYDKILITALDSMEPILATMEKNNVPKDKVVQIK